MTTEEYAARYPNMTPEEILADQIMEFSLEGRDPDLTDDLEGLLRASGCCLSGAAGILLSAISDDCMVSLDLPQGRRVYWNQMAHLLMSCAAVMQGDADALDHETVVAALRTRQLSDLMLD